MPISRWRRRWLKRLMVLGVPNSTSSRVADIAQDAGILALEDAAQPAGRQIAGSPWVGSAKSGCSASRRLRACDRGRDRPQRAGPPHRSRRALLTHWAPASGSGGELKPGMLLCCVKRRNEGCEALQDMEDLAGDVAFEAADNLAL